jgi:type II secretory pathway pseudopilin PulG
MMRTIKRPVFRSGFSLLELLVVIGIIMLLVAMLLPTFSKFRRNAKLAQCVANLQQIGVAGGNFASGNKGAITDIGTSAYKIPSWSASFSPGNSLGAWPSSPEEYNWIGLLGNVKRPITSGPKYAIGMGCLYVDNFLSSAKSYYCPMNEFGLTAKEPGEEFAGTDGFCKDHTKTEFTSAGYTYNPHNLLTLNGSRSYRRESQTDPNPGSQYSRSQAVWAMDILSPNFYSQYPFFNHSANFTAEDLEDDDVSFNLLHMDGSVSNNIISSTLRTDARSGTVNFNYTSWDKYIDEMINAAGQ